MTRRSRTTVPVALVATALVLASSTDTATASGEPASLERQWSIAAGSAVKIEVRKDGWYRVTRSQLERAGANFTVPGRLRLYAHGREVPMLVDRGGVEFYGQGLDTPSTDTRTYWLVRGASGGLRIRVASAQTQRRSAFARSFPFVLERRYRTRYASVQTASGRTTSVKPSIRSRQRSSSGHGIWRSRRDRSSWWSTASRSEDTRSK